MSSTSPGYGITIRVEGAPERQPVAQATTAITNAGARSEEHTSELQSH